MRARRWGGPSARVASFRIDPGNQEEQWVMVDWVELSSRRVKTRVVAEPRLSARLAEVDVRRRVQAGQRLAIVLLFEIEPAGEVRRANAYAQLVGAGAIISVVEKPVVVLAGQKGLRVEMGLSTLPAAVIRQIYTDAGVHVYLDGDDCFYADNGWLAVHGREPGRRVIDLPEPATLVSALGGWQAQGVEASIDLPAHSTEVLRLVR